MPPVLPSSSTNEDKQIIEDLKKSLAEVKARNRQLNINCSFLLATSKAELDRKNALIQSTRKELDSYLFRKRKVCQADTAEKGTQADLIRNSEEANSRKRTSQRDDSRRNRSPSRDRQRYTKEAHRSSDNKRRSRSPRYDRNRNKGNQDHERRRSRGRDERTSSRRFACIFNQPKSQ